MTPTSEKNILKALAIGISAVMLMQPAGTEAAALEQETEKEQVESTGEAGSKVESVRKSLADAKAELNGLKESAKGLDELANPSIDVLIDEAERKLTGCESYLDIIDADKKGILTDVAKENAGLEALACEDTLRACTESLNLLNDDLFDTERDAEALINAKEISELNAVIDESLEEFKDVDWNVEFAKINAYLSMDKETAKKCLKAAENVRNLKGEIDKL